MKREMPEGEARVDEEGEARVDEERDARGRSEGG